MKVTSDFLEKFDQEFAPRLGARAPTFRAVFEAVNYEPFIVETGCVRGHDNWAGDGQSTVMFDAFIEFHGGLGWSVDISKDAVAFAQSLVEHVEVTHSDSVKFLWEFQEPIHLLYLDSFDFDANEPMLAASHQMFEFCAAIKNLDKGSIVLCDDTYRRLGKLFGKGTLVAKYMEKIGVPILIEGECQVAWKL